MRQVKSMGALTALFAAAAFACSGISAARAEPLAYAAPAPQLLMTQPPPAAAMPRATEDSANDADVPNENARLPARFRTRVVDFQSSEPRGTIIIDTPHTYLYFILGRGKAIRYGIGVGREGFAWAGVKHIANKREWPDWYPPPEMIRRQPYLPRMMAGGPGNPLGSRALYIAGTEYRIHGTNDPTSIGKDVSSGCIHLTNDNAIDLYSRVRVGAKVIVLPQQGAPTLHAKNNPPGWRREVQAAIAASRQSLLETQSARMTYNGNRWNGRRRAELY